MIQKTIDNEKRTVETMIRLYCRKKEGNAVLCDDCKELLSYAFARLDHCKYLHPKGDDSSVSVEPKPTCRRCPIHCYKPAMRERIRQVMRWSGPRMILYHPILAIKHLFG